ncbi:retrovirus-related pol polyprotein from transposon TNT 1-94 [Tanacetum coccineum]
MESSNKELVDKLKGEIEDFKTKNKSLESSNNHFKEANNELSKTNQLMFKDLKKFQAELDKYNDVNYASKVEIDCAKAKGDLMSYKIEFEKSSNAYTRKINDLNQTISDMKKELCAHQETISIMSQAKEAQIKLYKTREDKELDKVIALENKVKCKEKIKNDKSFKENQSNVFLKEREQYFEIQDLKAQLQDKGIAIRVIPNTRVSIPQLKSNHLEISVCLTIVKEEARHVEDHRTVKFGNDQIAPILGYGDLVQGTITIKRVYYVEGLNHNLFSVGQFCDADLEVAFRKSTCYIRDLKGNDLLTATSSQAWLWHRRLSHLNFDTINLLSKNNIVNGLPKLKFIKDHLCSSCELGKAKRKSFHTKTTPSSKIRLQLLHMDLCGTMRVESINGKKYVLVIVDDYSRYTWTDFLRSKDETPRVLIDFLTLVQRGLHAQVTTVRTEKGTEFLINFHAYFQKEGIRHESQCSETPTQNGVVERWNRTLVEAARTMLSAAKVPLFFWAEAIAQHV